MNASETSILGTGWKGIHIMLMRRALHVTDDLTGVVRICFIKDFFFSVLALVFTLNSC